MERLPDGQFVWLRGRTADVYVHANKDGLSVSGQANRASRKAAWRVQHLLSEEGNLVLLLQGAAYGRYLATMEVPAPLGHHGIRVAQHDFNEPEALSIRWQAVRSADGDDFMLLHASPIGPHFLAMGIMGNPSPIIHYAVLPIPLRDTIPLLPGPRPLKYISILLRRNVEEDQMREVRYVRAGHDGLVDENWAAFPFAGRSVFNLRTQLAPRLGVEGEFIMCVRAGHEARLTPLVVDLPASNEPLHIVILMAGSQAIQELQHPHVDAA